MTLANVRVPVLALFGARTAGNPDVRIEVLPALNHLFQTSDTGSPAEYEQIEETFAPAALTLMGDWIEARAGR